MKIISTQPLGGDYIIETANPVGVFLRGCQLQWSPCPQHSSRAFGRTLVCDITSKCGANKMADVLLIYCRQTRRRILIVSFLGHWRPIQLHISVFRLSRTIMTFLAEYFTVKWRPVSQ